MKPRTDSRSYDWFAVLCRPQGEKTADRIFEDMGFATFLPTRTAWRYITHKNKEMGTKFEVEYALMPRYLFLGINQGTPGIGAVYAFMERPGGRRLIQGMLSDQGWPVVIPHDGRNGLRQLMWLHAGGEFRAPDYHRYMATYEEFNVGETGHHLGLGISGRVVDVTETQAQMAVQFFGAERLVSIKLEKVKAVA